MKNIFFLYLLFNFSIIISSPTQVTSGGTGISTTTAYGLMCAGISSTANLQSISSVGTSGQPIVSGGASSLPAFATLPISGGGTNATSLSSGVIQSNGSALSSLGIGSANQVLQNVAGTVGWAFTGLLQIASSSTTARISTSGGSAIPNDDTIPQITEGTQILTLAFTPKSSSSNLLIFFSTSGTPTASTPAIVSLFVDSTANALAAQYIGLRSSSNSNSGILLYVTPSASTTSRTYQIRVGGGSYQVNSGSGSRKFGGVASTYLVVAEVI